MKRIQLLKAISKLPILIGLLFIGFNLTAQTPSPFRNHEIIDAGNGMKVEVLSCRGTGENEECDVIYYTEKRYLGKRVWEKSSVLKEMKVAARLALYNKNKALSKPSVSTKENVGKPADVPLKQTTVVKRPNSTVDKPLEVVKEPKAKKDTVATAANNTTNFPSNPATLQPKDSLKNTQNNSILGAQEKLAPAIVSKPYGYTLASIYSLARERNLNVRQAQNVIDNFKLDEKIAKGSYLPSASYNIGHYFSRGKNIDPVTNTFSYENFSGGYTALAVQLELFSGFRRLNTVKQTGFNIKAAEYAKKKAELELLSGITLIYARSLLGKDQLAVQKSLIQNTAKEIEVINEKIKVGRLSKYEFYAFNARLNTQQAELVTLQNDSLSAINDLKELLNIPQSDLMEVVAIDTSFLMEIYSKTISAPEFIASILKQHPALKQAEMETESARLGEKISKSNYYPSLSLGGNVSSNYNANQVNVSGGKVPLSTQLNENIGQNLNINLRIPIFSQTENANRVKKERINIANAQLTQQTAENTITSNTLQLINDFNAARQKYQATKSAWEQNKLSYDLYIEKYRVGQISSVELLAAQDNLNASTSSYIQTKLQLFFQFQLLELLKSYN